MFIMPDQSSVISTSMGEEEWKNKHCDQSLPSLAISNDSAFIINQGKRQFVTYSYAVKLKLK